MIGRVYRGHGTAGLIRYLYGPARAESPVAHQDPHLVASWLGHTPAVLAALEPVPLAEVAADQGRTLAAVGGRGLSAGAARAATQLAAAAGQGSVWDDELTGAQDAPTGGLADADGAAQAGARRQEAVPGPVDARHLVRALEAPLREQQRAAKRGGPAPAAEHVWHVALRNADGDRRLTDSEWAQVAQDVVHRTGLSPRGQDGRPAEGGCPWVAVRHDDTSIHLVVVLAREDGKAVRLWRDYRQLREACRAAEQTYGLTATAPADGTADTHTSRAEVEKAARLARQHAAACATAPATDRAASPAAAPVAAGAGRRAGAEPARDQLRRHVQAAAAFSRTEQEFFGRLRAGGLLVRPRLSQQVPGQVTGYAVALPPIPPQPAADGQEPSAAAAAARAGEATAGSGSTADGRPVFFSGGKLAPDLTLPQLHQRWAEQQSVPHVLPEVAPTTTAPGRAEAASRTSEPAPAAEAAKAWQQASAAVQAARAGIDAARRRGATAEQQHDAVGAAWATADLLTVTARLLEGPAGEGPLSVAAQTYVRAARLPRLPPTRRDDTESARAAASSGRQTKRSHRVPPRRSDVSRDLRRAAAVLGAAGLADGDVASMLRLVAQVAELVEAVQGLREAQRHAAQASAARAAAAGLHAAVQQYAPAAPSSAMGAMAGRGSVAEELRAALRAHARQQSGSTTARPPRRPGPSMPPAAPPPRGVRR